MKKKENNSKGENFQSIFEKRGKNAENAIKREQTKESINKNYKNVVHKFPLSLNVKIELSG